MSAATPSVESRCLVYCRLRPDTKAEMEAAAEEGRLMDLGPKSVNVRGDKNYQFDGTFSGDSSQADLFESIGRPVVEHCLNGYRSALMAYGQTGTGKSFTMCCTKPGLEGIIPRAAQLLFETIEAQSADRTFSVQLQFLQIYRDNLGDLMTESGKDRVDIFFDKGGVTLPGCSIHSVTNTEEFMEVYNVGNARRVTTATAMNPESSRGHSALLVWVTSTPKDDATAAERRGKITFIDLAGYERFSKTGISNANAVMKDEAKTINASLLSLGHVVSSLSNGDKHVPWRNSKLTRLLQDSIGGRSRTTIVLTVGPSAEHLFETTNTLQFGQRAMAVKVQAKTTETVDYARLAAKLQTMLDEREERISALELQAASFDVAKEDLLSRHERDMIQMRGEHQREIESLRSEGASDERILKVVGQHEIERDNLIEQQREELEYNNEQNETTTKEIVENLTLNYETEMGEMRLRIEELEAVIGQKDGIIAKLQKLGGAKKGHAADDSVIVDDSGSSRTLTPSHSRADSVDLDPSGGGGGGGGVADSPMARRSQSRRRTHPNSPTGALNLNDFAAAGGGGGGDGEDDDDEDAALTLGLTNTLPQYGNEADRLRSAQLQAEVSRLATLCSQRAEDLDALKTYTASLKEELTAIYSADGAPSPTEALQQLMEAAPRVSAVTLVDAKVVEAKERDWGEQLNRKSDELEALRQELAALRAHNGAGGSTPPFGMTPRQSCTLPSGGIAADIVPLPLTARGSRNAGAGGSPSGLPPRHMGLTVHQSSAIVEQQRLQIEVLREELENANAEIAILYEAAEAAGMVEVTEEGDKALCPDKVTDALEEAKAEAAALAEELAALKAAKAEGGEEKATEADTQAEVEKEATVPAEAAAEFESKLAAAEETVSALTADLASEKERSAALEANVAALTAQLSQAEEGAAKAASAAAADVEAVKAKLSEAEAALATANASLAAAEATAEQHRTAAAGEESAAVAALEAAKADLSASEEKAEALAAGKAAAEEALAAAESANTTASEENARLTAALAAASAELEAAQAAVVEAAAKADGAHGEERQRLMVSIADLSASNDALTARLSAAEASTAEHEKATSDAAASASEENSRLTTALAAAEAALSASEERLRDHSEAAEASKASDAALRASLEEKVATLESAKTSTEASLAVAMEAVRAAEAQVAAAAETADGEKAEAIAALAAKLAAAEAAGSAAAEAHAAESEALKASIEALAAQLENGASSGGDATIPSLPRPTSAAMVKGEAEDGSDDVSLLRLQHELFTRLFAGDRDVMFVAAERGLRAHCAELTTRLTDSAKALEAARAEAELLKEILKRNNISDPTAEGKGGQFAKALSGSTSDFALITAFKDGEIALLNHRLELRERALYAMATQTTQLTHYAIDLRSLLEAHSRTAADAAAIPQLNTKLRYFGATDSPSASTASPHVFASYKQRREAEKEADATDAIRAQLEGLLSLMRAMRKQNALLQTAVMERSIMVKHYAWLLMALGSPDLPKDFDPEAIVGTIAADLRLAFAERDEELATRDQHLLQRSTELIVLEESVTELHSQLKANNIVPCRPASKFALSTLRTREEMQDELADRDEAKAKLITVRLDTIAEMDKVEASIAKISRQIAGTDADGNPLSGEAAAAAAAALHISGGQGGLEMELLRLRSRAEQLRSSYEVTEAKIKSQEREIDLLQHSIGQSSRIVVEMQAQRDLDVDLSVVEKFKARFLRK